MLDVNSVFISRLATDEEQLYFPILNELVTVITD